MLNFKKHRPYQPTAVEVKPNEDDVHENFADDDGNNSDDDDDDEDGLTSNTLDNEYQIADSKEDWIQLKEKLLPCLDHGIQQLNHMQNRVVVAVADSIDDIENGLPGIKLLLMGKAGTGKSFLIKTLNLLVKAKLYGYDRLPVIRCAHTGKIYIDFMILSYFY